jgi:hypothetical protein
MEDSGVGAALSAAADAMWKVEQIESSGLPVVEVERASRLAGVKIEYARLLIEVERWERERHPPMIVKFAPGQFVDPKDMLDPGPNPQPSMRPSASGSPESFEPRRD